MTVTHDQLTRMLTGGAARIRGAIDLLTELDSHGGDGDHGTTMARAMDRLEEALTKGDPADTGATLKTVGWAIMGVDGGAIGPLLGSFFMSMSKAGEGTLAGLFDAGLAGVEKNTRARVGDKTMMDALTPAVAALRSAVDEGMDLPDALARAADAAERGAEETIDLEARFGRAKNLGPDSRGHADPGATSIALLFRGFHDGIGQEGTGK